MARHPGLYLHVPFCSAICPYCDFAVTTGDSERQRRFTRALVAEIAHKRASWLPFDTLYLGGGTPSALGVDGLGKILEAVRLHLPAVSDATVSIEANPEDVTAQMVRAWSDLGIDRVSLGVQSFDDGELAFLGRRHTREQGLDAVACALDTGLSVSLDLIYGLPDQSAAAWRGNLDQAVALGPHHISCYQLTVEPGTPFARRAGRGVFSELDRDRAAELFFLTHETLEAAGYPAYEVSNFARTGADQCDHNRKYWEGGHYLGLGPSAHSFDGRSRWWNQRSEVSWRLQLETGRSVEAGREDLTVVELALEKVMLGLRTPQGVDLRSLAGIETGAFLARNSEVLTTAQESGLLIVEENRLIPSLAGMAQADALARSIRI